eukprot:5120230-Pyramimonas_sp.AAC.1
MTARLLVPLVAGALVAKGLGDKVVSKQMRRAPAQCISKLVWACSVELWAQHARPDMYVLLACMWPVRLYVYACHPACTHYCMTERVPCCLLTEKEETDTEREHHAQVAGLSYERGRNSAHREK